MVVSLLLTHTRRYSSSGVAAWVVGDGGGGTACWSPLWRRYFSGVAGRSEQAMIHGGTPYFLRDSAGEGVVGMRATVCVRRMEAKRRMTN